MKDRTRDNIYKAFVGEAKAYFRLLAYAEKADEEEVPQIALLFRAIADAERVHATRHLNSLKEVMVKDTDTNLEKSFQRKSRLARTNIRILSRRPKKTVKKWLPLPSPRPGTRKPFTPSSTSVPS